MIRALIILVFFLCSCRQDEVINEMTLLTNDSSKLWILYEHNFVMSDNSKFVSIPPYVFLNIYGATHLRLDEDLTFSLGQHYGNWLFSPSEKLLHLSTASMNNNGPPLEPPLDPQLGFTLMKLSPRQLILRKEAPQGSFLPYYEFRFKSD